MTAGKGIVHAEMPGSFDFASTGFQLWINLDAKNKFCQPQYQEYLKDIIPSYTGENGMIAKVISGEVFGVKGPIVARTPTYFLDFIFENQSSYEHEIPVDWNCILVCYKGKCKLQNSKVIDSMEVA